MEKIIRFQQLINSEIEKLSSSAQQPKELYDPISYTLSLGGKRMRPLLVLLGSDLFDGEPEQAISLALGIELFHNFTLIHDDIMDNAPLRRSKEAVHKKWSPNIAILSGDAMLVKAYEHVSKTDKAKLPLLLNLFNETAIKVCEGQQLDMNYEQATTVSIPQYLKMIELKTAVLLAGALKMGAIVAGADEEESQRLYAFGRNIGIAFQLQDDILDVYGDENKFGKQKGGDIISNKKTWLLLKALDMTKQNHYKFEELNMWLNASVAAAKEKVEAVTAIYDGLNVLELAKMEMMRYYEMGLKQLSGIKAAESKKQDLITFVNGLITREI